eukprot:5834990-Lingulodinium_polyedra.AAC.1
MDPSLPARRTRSDVLTSKDLQSATGSTAPDAASVHCRRTRWATSGPRPRGTDSRSAGSAAALPL